MNHQAKRSRITDDDKALMSDFWQWLHRLEKLTTHEVTPEDWYGYWYDGYSPAEAFEAGPDRDWQDG